MPSATTIVVSANVAVQHEGHNVLPGEVPLLEFVD